MQGDICINYRYKKACKNWYYTLKKDKEREYDFTEIFLDLNDSARQLKDEHLFQ